MGICRHGKKQMALGLRKEIIVKVKIHLLVEGDDGVGDVSWYADLKMNPLSTKNGILRPKLLKDMYIDCMPELHRDISKLADLMSLTGEEDI